MGAIAASGIMLTIKGNDILRDVSLAADDGQLVGLLGPNGSGKTTLLRVLAGLLRPDSGSVSYDGIDLRSQRRRAIARRLAVVEQDTVAHVDLRVRQVVELGRTPFRGRFDALTGADQQAIDNALAQVDVLDIQHRYWHTLSGGEKQRAQLARALAQNPREVLLDEPTNHLDIRHQIELLELLRSIKLTCVIALHDLNFAARYCEHLVVLDRGYVAAAGRPEDVLTADLMAQVYEIDTTIERDRTCGAVRVIYNGVHARRPDDTRGL